MCLPPPAACHSPGLASCCAQEGREERKIHLPSPRSPKSPRCDKKDRRGTRSSARLLRASLSCSCCVMEGHLSPHCQGTPHQEEQALYAACPWCLREAVCFDGEKARFLSLPPSILDLRVLREGSGTLENLKC